MRFTCHASGSSGNLYTVESNGSRLMIECGLPIQKISKKLDYSLQGIEACLVSHGHQDHCKAWREIAKSGIDIYMTQGTKDALKAEGHRIKVVQPLVPFSISSFKIKAFDTQHDTEGSAGYLVQDNEGKTLVYLTDSYYSRYVFKGLNIIAVECNYSEDLLEENLKNGTTDRHLYARVKRSHFGLQHVKQFLLANDLSKVEEIFLLHLSSRNADEEVIRNEIMRATGKQITIC